ncbi:hypothetical protein BGW36DRAFT_425550 [Talaromyces proteolyticus]|uniref:Septin-type G domain-containing protein n=1 Tax=Talaromyces proteolyticus TaxID=1131652 RepID=A0AAD4L0P4_9EURO|nr:uncharacterized protein BGW36DRAFT_425550 [Talaromyces proteolyticus]KAH8700739.1 hypothetical protein BGW36DRAFT_425550 [Talaromyces proteolyticus]
MRPVVPDYLQSPARKSASCEQPVPSWADNQTTFFLARETDDDLISSRQSISPRESMYGVQSLEETIITADSCVPVRDITPKDVEPPRRRTTLKPSDLLHHVDRSDLASHGRVSPIAAPSRPLTPFGLQDDPSSLPSSPKSTSTRSLKPLDDLSITDEINSQVLASSGEEEDEVPETGDKPNDSSSQLIMPSIRMPSRRPFTDRGKGFGRFKLLVAGPKGSGKSSLIKSIVQACDDIVHVDPVERSTLHESHRPRASTNPRTAATVTLSEIYASTKPYPPWWSDLEDSRVLRRRKNSGEIVLERNLCFVDTVLSNKNRLNQTETIIQYMRQQLSRAVTAVRHPSLDFQNMLGGNGGSQVDVLLYLISEETLSSDVECIHKLSDFTNVIPLISKADLLSASQITDLKKSFHSHIEGRGIRPFFFESSGSHEASSPQSPFAVSSARSSDDDNMDASVLMSPDYIQPLFPSELSGLIDKIFDCDNMSWLRHSAAKKIIQNGSSGPPYQPEPVFPKTLRQRSISPARFSPSPGLTSNFLSLEGAPGYAMARVTDYTQNEEKLARVRLAKWAADLQQSLQNERERYAALARGDRAVWLTERLGECVVDGSLVPIHQTPGFPTWTFGTDKAGGVLVRTSNGQTGKYRLTKLNPKDPLGLVRWNDDLRRRGWIIVQVVGSFGVVGGLALWLAKLWGLPSQSLSEWQFHWISSQD